MTCVKASKMTRVLGPDASASYEQYRLPSLSDVTLVLPRSGMEYLSPDFHGLEAE
jgi:hypothetical protein